MQLLSACKVAAVCATGSKRSCQNQSQMSRFNNGVHVTCEVIYAVAVVLQAEDATVTVVHSKTKDAQALCAEADILIAAIGKAEMVKADWVKPGAAVIDVGTNPVPVSPPWLP